MVANKMLRNTMVVAGVLLTVACQEQSELSDVIALNNDELHPNYMYTLTIPEIMEISISNPAQEKK